MAEGSIAIFRDSGSDAIPNSWQGITYDIEAQDEDSIVTPDTTDTVFTVEETGNYFVGYHTQLDENALTPVSAELLGAIEVNGTQLSYGRSQGYWRDLQSCNKCALNGATLWDFVAGDELEVVAQHGDSLSAANGATIRDPSSADLYFWRLLDSWPIVRARRTSNGTASTTSDATLIWEQAQVVEAPWNFNGSTISYEPVSNGEYVFLVTFNVEAENDSTTDRGLFEAVLQYQDDVGGSWVDVGRMTSYSRGAGGQTTAVCAYAGLVEGQNSDNNFQFRVQYRHRHSGSNVFTPQGTRCAISIAAIPKGDAQWFFVREAAGGQQADTDAAVAFDTTEYEDSASYDHDPGTDETLITTQVQEWTMVFAQAYVAPNGSRSTSARLLYQLSILDNGSELNRTRCRNYDRGATGCDRAGGYVCGVIQSRPAGQTISLGLDNESNQTDSVQELQGGYLTRLSGIRIKQFQGIDEFPVHITEEVNRALLPTARAVDEAVHLLETQGANTGMAVDELVHLLEDTQRVIGFTVAVDETEAIVERPVRALTLARAIDELAVHILEEANEQPGILAAVDELVHIQEEALQLLADAVFGWPAGASARGGSVAGDTARGGSSAGDDYHSPRTPPGAR